MKNFKKLLAVILSVMMLTGLMTGITFADENTVEVTVTYDYYNYIVYQNGTAISDGDVIEVVPGQDYTFEVGLVSPAPTAVNPDSEETVTYPQFTYFNAYVNNEQINDESIDISGGTQSVTASFTEDSTFAVAGKTFTISNGTVTTTKNRKDKGVSFNIRTENVPYGTDCKMYIDIDPGYRASAKNAQNGNEAGKMLNTFLYIGYYKITDWSGVGRGFTDTLMWNEEESDPDNGVYCFDLTNLTSILTMRVGQYGVDTPASMTLLQPTTINVNFYTGEEGTELYATKTGTYNSLLAKPQDPTKEGASFDGWYTADGEEYDFTSVVKSVTDLNLYAHFNSDCDVEFIDQGETYDTVTVTYGSTVDSPAKPASGPQGTSFLGWFLSETSDEQYDFDTPVTGNLTLYSRWGTKVTGVFLDKTEAAIQYGDSLKLTATTAPADATIQTVKWSSSDEKVATVDQSGNVTPLTCGTAVITAKNGNCSAECNVTVNHTLTKTDATESTCYVKGNTAYWTCSTCGKYFSDEEGTTEIEKDSWTLPYAHTFEKVDGLVKCTKCGELYTGIWTDKNEYKDGQIVLSINENGYIVSNGRVQKNLGIVKIGDDLYYGNSAGKVSNYDGSNVLYYTVKAAKTNDLINEGLYKIGKDGKIESIFIYKGYYYVNGSIQKGAGVISLDGDYYYINGTGAVANYSSLVESEYTIKESKTNGLIGAGFYEFDAGGKIIVRFIYRYNYYYDNGVNVLGAGMVNIGDDLYYVKANGIIFRNGTTTVKETKTNGLCEAGTHTFNYYGVMTK